MKTLSDRDDDLMLEAKRLGLSDKVHQPFDMLARVMAYADVLGYDPDFAISPDIPLKRIRPPQKP